MTRRVSLKDIAQKVGVSTALVSYVLNNQKVNRINKELAQKIKDTAKELDYRPNQLAKSLKTAKSLTIGLIVSDISNPFFSNIARIIQEEADNSKYTVLFGSSDESAHKSAQLADTFINRQVDGLIIAPSEGAEEQLAYLQRREIPFVLIDRYFPALETNYVALDNYRAAYEAVSHLLDKGYTRIGMVTHETGLFHLKERRYGYEGALKDRGIAPHPDWVKEISLKQAKTAIPEVVDQLLGLVPRMDALLMGSNTLADLTVKHIHALGYKVPKDLAILTFDEVESLDLFYAPISYLRQPLPEMGRLAIQVLLDNMEKNNTQLSQIQLPAELVLRAST